MVVDREPFGTIQAGVNGRSTIPGIPLGPVSRDGDDGTAGGDRADAVVDGGNHLINDVGTIEEEVALIVHCHVVEQSIPARRW